MILLSMLLIAALIAGAGLIVFLVFKPKWTWLRMTIVIALAATILMGGICTIASAQCKGQIEDLRAESEHIMLYYNTINYSTNEYVRFDFYQQVKDYNALYTHLQKQSESVWIGAFYPKGWDEQIGLIDFMLNGGEENGYFG